MAATYSPRGYPKAAIDHLKSLLPGAVLTSAELGMAIGLEDMKQITSLMGFPIKHGLLERLPDPNDGRRSCWRLGSGVPAQGTQAEPGDDPLLTQRTAVIPPALWAAPRKPAMPKALRLALYSDDILLIERNGKTLTFNADETREIVAFIHRLAPAEV